MISKGLALAGGVCCAAVLSQVPEFSQQYTQRLSGAVDELSGIVAQFDADAEQVGMSRTEALNDLSKGTAMAQARAESMGYVLARHDRLNAHLEQIRGTGPVGKLATGLQYLDPELARNTWDDFKPAVPVTVEGAAFGGAGFLGGYGLIALVLAGFGRMRRRPQATPAE